MGTGSIVRYIVFVVAVLLQGCIVIPGQERKEALRRLEAACEAKGMALLSHDEVEQHGIANITPYETTVSGMCVSKDDPRLTPKPQVPSQSM